MGTAIFAGLAYNSYLSGRIFFILPLIYVFYISYKAKQWKNALLFSVVLFVITAPLNLYLLQHGDNRFSEQSFMSNKELSILKKAEFIGENVVSSHLMLFYPGKGDIHGTHNYPYKHAQGKETRSEVSARYSDIASDAVSVAFDQAEQPLFSGPSGRVKTALYILAVARMESNFIRRIDAGECNKGECDNGQASCMMQIHAEGGIVLSDNYFSYASSKDETWRKENQDKIITASKLNDRKTCFKVALHIIRSSFASCRSYPVEDRLGGYTGEGCRNVVEKRRNMKSRARYAVYQWGLSRPGLPADIE
jgi:hypothetical protein